MMDGGLEKGANWLREDGKRGKLMRIAEGRGEGHTWTLDVCIHFGAGN